jgi:hypothetical protein
MKVVVFGAGAMEGSLAAHLAFRRPPLSLTRNDTGPVEVDGIGTLTCLMVAGWS